MYRVICRFADRLDENYIYEVGDIYPRKGIDVANDRIKELASDKNQIKKPLIEKIMAEPVKAEEEIKTEKPKAKRK